jgi:PAS domain S-box-containing protein
MVGPAKKTPCALLRLAVVPVWVCAGFPAMVVFFAPAGVTAAASPEDVSPTGFSAALMSVLVLLAVLALAADGPHQWTVKGVEDLARFVAESPDPVLRITEGGEVLYANGAGLSLLRELGSDVGGPAPETWQQVIQRVLASGGREAFEESHDGQSFSIWAVPVAEKGYVNLYAHDVTDRRCAEAEVRRLAAVVRDSNDAITVHDFDGHIFAWNRGAQEMYGWSEAEALGMSISDLIPEGDPEGLPARVTQMREGQPVQPFETQRVTRDGRILHVWVTLTVLWDDAGRPVGVATTERDITERKRAETEREKLVAELEARNRELERFTYTVSHDLKSPLITIKGFAGLLAKEIADGDVEQVESDLARIRNAADRMHQLLDELLELSRVGHLVNSPQEVPLSCLAREALDLVATRIGKSGVAVSIPPDLPVVCGDRPRLLSVMQNLLDNAAKFMGDQPEPNIQIGARMDGDEAICWVRDNGIGIDPRYHERIFGLFEKLNSDSKEGTGIGLALAKRIVEAHGGRIWVESDGRGRGATFYFSIPRKGGLAHDTIAKP